MGSAISIAVFRTTVAAADLVLAQPGLRNINRKGLHHALHHCNRYARFVAAWSDYFDNHGRLYSHFAGDRYRGCVA
jgi:hypothetical protein